MKQSEIDVGRRNMLKTVGAGAVAATLGPGAASAAAAADTGVRPAASKAGEGPYNILFILTDQERYFRPGELPHRLPAARARAAREEGHRVREPPHQLVRLHAIALGALHRPAHPADEDVRQHELPVDQQHVHRAADGRRHAARSRLLHGLQGQVAPDQGIRDGQRARHADEDLHQGNGGLRLLRLLRRRRHHRARPGRLPARRHHLGDGRELAARPRHGARGAGQAVVSRGEPRQSARHHVPRHRSPGRARCRARNMLGRIRPEPAHPLYAKQWAFELPATYRAAARCDGAPGGARRLHAVARRPRRHISPTRTGAGGGATTTISIACATSTATSLRCSTSSSRWALRRGRSSCSPRITAISTARTACTRRAQRRIASRTTCR